MNDAESDESFVVVPPDRLPADVLDALIEDFILREGANLGAEETALETKVDQVRKQLTKQTAVIVYHLEEETTRIIPAQHLRKMSS